MELRSSRSKFATCKISEAFKPSNFIRSHREKERERVSEKEREREREMARKKERERDPIEKIVCVRLYE